MNKTERIVKSAHLTAIDNIQHIVKTSPNLLINLSLFAFCLICFFFRRIFFFFELFFFVEFDKLLTIPKRYIVKNSVTTLNEKEDS